MVQNVGILVAMSALVVVKVLIGGDVLMRWAYIRVVVGIKVVG